MAARAAAVRPPLDEDLTINVCLDPVDFRMGVNGLSVLIEASLKYDPFSRNLFCFTNKRKNQIKVVYWERSGFCLWLKWLEEERFKWPTHMRPVAEDHADRAPVARLTQEQLSWLLDGLDLKQLKPHRALEYRSAVDQAQTKHDVWRRSRAQISYPLRAMDEAPPRPADLPDDPATLKALVREQAFEIERLKEELRLATHKRFGASSEKADPDQGQLFNEAEVLGAKPPASEADEITIPAHTRAKGGRKPIDDRLPRERIEHDILESEKLCPCGSGHLRPRIGEIVTEQADIEPAKVKVVQHVRFKYGPVPPVRWRVPGGGRGAGEGCCDQR